MKYLHPACYVIDNKYCSTGSGLWLTDTYAPFMVGVKKIQWSDITKCNLYTLLVCQSHSKQKSISADVVHVHTVWNSYFSLHVKNKLCLNCDMLSTLWLRFQDIGNANQLFSCNLHGLHSQKLFHSKIKHWSGNERQQLYKITCSCFRYPLSHLTLCRSYLKPYCMGRKTAFFQRAFKFMYYTRNKIITIKLIKTEW